MTDYSMAAIALGGKRLELDEVQIPPVQEIGGLLCVEACGVCGSDIKKYSRSSMPPTILGHETVGRIVGMGAVPAKQWGVSEGDRVLLEEYLPCGHCWYCRSGEFRSCTQTDNVRDDSIRYGSTPMAVPPALWGGYSQYQYLHLNSVLHVVPEHVPSEHATFALPLSNGIQWAQMDAGVRSGDTVVIQGPGQQGLGCLIAAKGAGAGRVIVSGLARDGRRLALAGRLGADHVVDVERDALEATVEEATNGRLADVVIDASGGGIATFMTALRVVHKRGTVILASGSADAPSPLNLNLIRKKQVTVKGVRGHSFEAVEVALAHIASGRVDLASLCNAPFPLRDVKGALETTEGLRDAETVHVSVCPWE